MKTETEKNPASAADKPSFAKASCSAKPATQGEEETQGGPQEWTPERVTFYIGSIEANALQRLVTAINASIAAGREKSDKLGWLLLDAQKQLAAAQEAIKQFNDSREDAFVRPVDYSDTAALDAYVARKVEEAFLSASMESERVPDPTRQ